MRYTYGMKNQSKDERRINLFLNPEIVKAAKIQALPEETSLSKLVDKALKQYMEGKE